MPARSYVIVGGGISGLAVAYELSKDLDAEITVLEVSDHVGGKLSSNEVAGRIVDAGPDALLIRDPAVRALVTELGLIDRMTPPAVRGSFVWTRGRLRTLPQMTQAGVPLQLGSLMRSGIVGWSGLLRAAADFVLPRRRHGEDPTVGELIRPRVGAAVFDRLVDPLLGGIYAGRADSLSAQSAVPEVARVLMPARSIYRTLRAQSKQAPAPSGAPAGPPLVNFPGGMPAIVRALVDRTRADIQCNAEVVRVKQRGDGRWRIRLADGRKLKADVLIMATPATVTSSLLRKLDTKLADAVAAIPYANVANVTFAYPRNAVPFEPHGTGFLVPAVDGRFIVGCTWMDEKWGRSVLTPSPGAGTKSADDIVIIRASVGRQGDDRWITMSDEAIAERAHSELVEAMKVSAPPLQWVVRRWPSSMPQYTVGHAQRLDVIDKRLGRYPGLYVTGAAYRGVGVASCLAQSTALARRITA